MSKMSKILISMCLLGHPVRYNGLAKTMYHPILERWKTEGRLVVLCPEIVAGLSTPRPPAEIELGESGDAVLAGTARVLAQNGTDMTDFFLTGARIALELAQKNDCRFALLTEGSPSCGSKEIHDGTFSGDKHVGAGVTATLLRQNGIRVFSETEINLLENQISISSPS